jgi:hypothetical protein
MAIWVHNVEGLVSSATRIGEWRARTQGVVLRREITVQWAGVLWPLIRWTLDV